MSPCLLANCGGGRLGRLVLLRRKSNFFPVFLLFFLSGCFGECDL